MATRLGLDIGTNSIGWCLYDGDTIRDIGVRIFSDGRDPKSGASLAVDRRDARAMRRRRDRYLGRRSALVDVLIKHGLLPAEKRAGNALHSEDPYALRVGALDEKLAPHQIGRALFLSPLTAKTHVSRIMSKLLARDRVQLVVVAYETGLVTPGRTE